MQPRLLLIPLFICCVTNALAQQDTIVKTQYRKVEREKFISILLGYNYYSRNGAEIGIGKVMETSIGPHAHSTVVYVSTEVAPYNKQLLWGPKIGAWTAGGCCGMSLGASLIYYIHPEATSLKIRPEIGIGFSRFRAYYGWALALTNKNFWPISESMFGITVNIKAKPLNSRSN